MLGRKELDLVPDTSALVRHFTPLTLSAREVVHRRAAIRVDSAVEDVGLGEQSSSNEARPKLSVNFPKPIVIGIGEIDEGLIQLVMLAVPTTSAEDVIEPTEARIRLVVLDNLVAVLAGPRRLHCATSLMTVSIAGGTPTGRNSDENSPGAAVPGCRR